MKLKCLFCHCSEVKTSVSSSAYGRSEDDVANAGHDKDDDDEGDEDGVFELLDDALGDSASCSSQRSEKSDVNNHEYSN